MHERLAILVIDDDEPILDLLSDALSPTYTVSSAHNVIEGVAALATRSFDLMIVDLILPYEDVAKWIQQIRQEPKFQAIPILICTAYRDWANRIPSQLVQGVLLKPFTIDDLLHQVAETIRQSKENAAGGAPLSASMQ